MGTAVLPSRDCLKHRPHRDFYDSRPPQPMNSSRNKPLRSPPQKQPGPAWTQSHSPVGTAVLPSRDCRPHRDFYDSRPPRPMNSSHKKPLRSPPQKQPRPAWTQSHPPMGTAVLPSRDCRPHRDFYDSRPPRPMNSSHKKPVLSPPQKQPGPAWTQSHSPVGTTVLPSRDCRPHRDFYNSRPPRPMNSSCNKPLRSPPQKQPGPARSKPNPARAGRRSGYPHKENNSRRRSGYPHKENNSRRRSRYPHKENNSGRRSGQPEARKPLVMGQFTLLKRGEKPLPPAAERRSDGDVLCSTNRMGPDPKILPKLPDLKMAAYAGPGFNISPPSPSSLPFPVFLLKKSADAAAIKSEIATRGLRRLLRLDERA